MIKNLNSGDLNMTYAEQYKNIISKINLTWKLKIMDKKLYDIVYGDIMAQFGAGDYIEYGDREACAEQIVEDLEKYGYKQIMPLRDFVVTVSDLINVREKAFNDARKETAKKILQALFDNHFEKVNDYENRSVGYHDFYCEIKRLAEKYGVEVDE